MDKIIKQISEGLANQSSRRGFFSTVGKATLGLATIIAGQGFFTANAAAQSLQCCTGTGCSACSSESQCDSYTWCCIGDYPKGSDKTVPCGTGTTTCTDCFKLVTKQNGKQKCVYDCTIYPKNTN